MRIMPTHDRIAYFIRLVILKIDTYMLVHVLHLFLVLIPSLSSMYLYTHLACSYHATGASRLDQCYHCATLAEVLICPIKVRLRCISTLCSIGLHIGEGRRSKPDLRVAGVIHTVEALQERESVYASYHPRQQAALHAGRLDRLGYLLMKSSPCPLGLPRSATTR